jgi:hypothetical protein
MPSMYCTSRNDALTIIFRGKNMPIMRGKRFLLAVLLCSPLSLSQGKKMLEIFSLLFAFEEGKQWQKKDV